MSDSNEEWREQQSVRRAEQQRALTSMRVNAWRGWRQVLVRSWSYARPIEIHLYPFADVCLIWQHSPPLFGASSVLAILFEQFLNAHLHAHGDLLLRHRRNE